ncbi:dihydrodipicolinate synthase family protein [Pararhodobacter sp. CCB-MM2]|uniref:dihydrodipicolinate synthase family protein n=1 Tax=Pararhodobacter sp. CCB-MM2 TaxID=1786003 RepID=UPI00082D6191|nr:dihydrodipicolinate synthase family protein [Pararhodobacter sp. CCB-MM2]
MTTPFHGLSAFPITPMDTEGRVQIDALQGLVARLAAAGVDSIGLLGSTGSYMYLTRSERARALSAALEVAGNVPVIVGVGALRTDEAVALAREAAQLGATAGLLAPVSYTPLTQDEVFDHFATVAREGGLPLVIYDNPGTTHFRFAPALIKRLAELPGIVAVKNPTDDPSAIAPHLASQRAELPDAFSIGYSGDWNASRALLDGADAWYSVLAGILPAPCLRLTRAAQRGDRGKVAAVEAQLAPLWALFRQHSSYRVVHAMARMQGLIRTDPPAPMKPLPPSVETVIADALRALAFD